MCVTAVWLKDPRPSAKTTFLILGNTFGSKCLGNLLISLFLWYIQCLHIQRERMKPHNMTEPPTCFSVELSSAYVITCTQSYTSFPESSTLCPPFDSAVLSLCPRSPAWLSVQCTVQSETNTAGCSRSAGSSSDSYVMCILFYFSTTYASCQVSLTESLFGFWICQLLPEWIQATTWKL